MTRDNDRAPSLSAGSATTGPTKPTPGADFGAAYRDETRRQIAAGEISTVDADLNFQVAEFCEKYGVVPCNDRRNWFGFGTVTVLFNDPDGGYWVPLGDVHAVSGMEWGDLKAKFFDELAEDTGEVAELTWLINDDGDRNAVPLAEHGFCMRAMLAGPWAREWSSNLEGVFRRAALNAGLAGKVGSVVIVGEGGRPVLTEMSLLDVLSAGGVPTEEEARERAMRGPLGGVL